MPRWLKLVPDAEKLGKIRERGPLGFAPFQGPAKIVPERDGKAVAIQTRLAKMGVVIGEASRPRTVQQAALGTQANGVDVVGERGHRREVGRGVLSAGICADPQIIGRKIAKLRSATP